jgi:protein ImuB
MDTRFLSPTPGSRPPAGTVRRARRPPPTDATSPQGAPLLAPPTHEVRAVAVVVEPLPLWLALRRDPTLARAPLVAHDEGHVVHANPPARRLGITRGMRLDGARLRAPHLELIDCHEPGVAQAWRDLTRELTSWTPWLDVQRRGRAFLRLPADEAADLARRLDARVGVADDLETAELAALAGRPGTARTVPADEGAAFLERLPLRFLRGVGLPDGELTRLRWLGLTTVGDLARWTPDQVRAYLGDVADALRPYLHGPRQREVAAWRPPAVLRRSLAFDQPLFEPHDLEPALDRLARSLALDLAGRAARHVTVAAEGAGGPRRATRVAKRPLRRAGQIRQQALFALRDTGAAVHGVEGLSVELAEPERVAESVGLWDARAQRELALDAVLERFPRALVQVAWGDPHAPACDRAWGWSPLEDAVRPAGSRTATAAGATAGAPAPRAPAARRATTPATTPARAALEAPLGAVTPAEGHAGPPLLASATGAGPDVPRLAATTDGPTRRPDRPLSPTEGDAWARRWGAGTAERWTDPQPAPAASTSPEAAARSETTTPEPTPAATTADHAASGRRPAPRIPDLLRDADLIRAERWPGSHRAA